MIADLSGIASWGAGRFGFLRRIFGLCRRLSRLSGGLMGLFCGCSGFLRGLPCVRGIVFHWILIVCFSKWLSDVNRAIK